MKRNASASPRSPRPATESAPRKSRSSATPSPSKKPRPRVAFLGLGAMGAPMAANVARVFALTAWNRTPSRARGLQRLGAEVAATPREAVAGADVVVTMLADGRALFDVLGGPDGVLAGLEGTSAKRPLVVDMSTIGPAAAREAARAVEAAGGRFVDAPVSGSVGPATRGELVAMAGGRVNDVARAERVLATMCRRVIHAGGVGQGQALKVVLNGVGAHHLVAFCSMLALAERAGLAREVVVDAFTSGAFASPSYVQKRSKVLARDYSPEFSLALTLKDAELAVALQDELRFPLPVHRAVAKAIAAGVEAGLGAEDLFALEKIFADVTSDPPPRPLPGLGGGEFTR